MKALCKGKTRDRHFPYPSSPCNNAAWKDGFCKLHHPDEKLKRIKERMKKKEGEGMIKCGKCKKWDAIDAVQHDNKRVYCHKCWDSLTAELAECDKWKERVQVRDDHIDALKSEITALKNWKESQLIVEESWNPQEIAKILEMTLGISIRKNIFEGIKKLKAENTALKEQIQYEQERNANNVGIADLEITALKEYVKRLKMSLMMNKVWR